MADHVWYITQKDIIPRKRLRGKPARDHSSHLLQIILYYCIKSKETRWNFFRWYSASSISNKIIEEEEGNLSISCPTLPIKPAAKGKELSVFPCSCCWGCSSMGAHECVYRCKLSAWFRRYIDSLTWEMCGSDMANTVQNGYLPQICQRKMLTDANTQLPNSVVILSSVQAGQAWL